MVCGRRRGFGGGRGRKLEKEIEYPAANEFLEEVQAESDDAADLRTKSDKCKKLKMHGQLVKTRLHTAPWLRDPC